MKRKFILAPGLLALLLLSGCNTIAGVGKDLQAGGRAISEASDEVADSIRDAPNEYAASGEKCDPAGRELKGRSSLPRCK